MQVISLFKPPINAASWLFLQDLATSAQITCCLISPPALIIYERWRSAQHKFYILEMSPLFLVTSQRFTN
jgi:hypothetical protein